MQTALNTGIGSPGEASGATQYEQERWQLRMFRRSLKKQLKLKALLAEIGDPAGKRCLLVTCGDNNGALNWHFRHAGGAWTWAEIESRSLAEMAAFLGDPVDHVRPDVLPYPDGHFDCVISIDVLEHLDDAGPFLAELHRVLRAGGSAVVTVPNGDPALLANRIKHLVGMTPAVYGHTRAGYTDAELSEAVAATGLTPTSHSGYSRFFTEIVELTVNFGYVFVLSRKKADAPGTIAPASSGDLKTHGLAYKLYSVLYPAMAFVSRLDRLLPASTNNAVIVKALKEG
jgi:SAM-dependent methyltransferase